MKAISIDFDGVIVVNEYPRIGSTLKGAKDSINELYNTHYIIINTCRSGEAADEAKQFLIDNGINFHAFNENLPHLIKKYNTDTRKISADIYIDDKNIGGFRGWKRTMKAIKKRPVIFTITGESGSGKTTLAKEVEGEFGVKVIQSYTDRPPRYDGEKGHTFLTSAQFDDIEKKGMIAYTKFGGYRYCCLHEDVYPKNIYIIDEDGLRMLKDNHSDKYNIITIRLLCNEKERIDRVGEERVSRDNGRFNMPPSDFEFTLFTDTLDVRSRRELINFIGLL